MTRNRKIAIQETPKGRWVSLCHSALPALGVAGVYVIFGDQGMVRYVGSSINLRARLSGFHRMPCLESRVKVKASKRFGDYLMWEARLIRALQPSGNIRHNESNPSRRRPSMKGDY